MSKQPLQVISWPQAIVHIDGDCFFASVEQALNSAYRDKPLVTGFERGIASSMSKEAKAMGIKRGTPIALIKTKYPDCLIVPGNYEAYSAFANRMFAIMREYTPIVEEYSIDEAFADVTGMRRCLHKSYKDIGLAMQTDIEKDLDITVSVGVSLTKSLAKLCSKFRKPHGLTCVKGHYIHILLERTNISDVWGIGRNTTSFLQKHNCLTAYDFVNKPFAFVRKYLTKKEEEIYKELRGEQVYQVDPDQKTVYKSISKGKTFTPTTDPSKIYAQLAKNIEEATAKCRKYKLIAKKFMIVLKTQAFEFHGQGAVLNRPSSNTIELLEVAQQLFKQAHQSGIEYRSTLCLLDSLQPDNNQQMFMFEDTLQIEKLEQISATMDTINHHFGHGTIYSGSSMQARYQQKQELSIPKLEIVV